MRLYFHVNSRCYDKNQCCNLFSMTMGQTLEYPVKAIIPDHQDLNQAICKGFYRHMGNTEIKRTHLFNGRYENIYLDETHVPELKGLLDQACSQAGHILGVNNLQAGSWFNHMPPGSLTLPHRHDDDDELLSAVYYVKVPENSGHLIIHTDGDDICITPEVGLLVFFKPDSCHEVTKNQSLQDRLSIGINFGRKPGQDDG